MTAHLPCTPETAAGIHSAETGGTDEITDKAGFAARWHFSVRTVDNLLRDGLPHVKYGKRRVRIVVREGDDWIRQRFGQQRRGAVRANPNNARSRRTTAGGARSKKVEEGGHQ